MKKFDTKVQMKSMLPQMVSSQRKRNYTFSFYKNNCAALAGQLHIMLLYGVSLDCEQSLHTTIHVEVLAESILADVPRFSRAAKF
jgi:hypothetical protein